MLPRGSLRLPGKCSSGRLARRLGLRGLDVASLDDAARLDRLASDMARAFRGAGDPVAEAEALIAQFETGLRET